MKEIDTIREALEIALRNYQQEMAYAELPDGPCNKYRQALAALSTIDNDRLTLAEKLRQYLPHCGKLDMTNRDRELVEWVDSILGKEE